MSERLSILIVTHNRIHYLKTTLIHIARNTTIPYELLIYDNKSDKQSVRFLKKVEEKQEVPTKIFYGKENIGVWQASNILIAHASSKETLGFIKCDNDCIVETKGWASKWIKLANELPQIGIIGANAENIRKRNKGLRIFKHRGRDVSIQTRHSTGVCVYWPARSFKKYGFYQENFGCMGQGDKDIGERLKIANQWFIYDDAVQVDRHKPGRHDHYGGYRQWKNRYVKNNRPLLYRNCEEYMSGKRPIGIWYKKFRKHISKEIREQEGFQYSDPTPLVNWETGELKC